MKKEMNSATLQQECLNFTRNNNNSTDNDLAPVSEVLEIIRKNFEDQNASKLFFGFVEFGDIFKDEMTKFPSVLNHGISDQCNFISINLDKIRNTKAFDTFCSDMVSLAQASNKVNDFYVALFSQHAQKVENKEKHINKDISDMIRAHKLLKSRAS